MSWRYRYAWLSARRRAATASSIARFALGVAEDSARLRLAWTSARRRANNAQGSVVFWKQTAAGLEQSVKNLSGWLEEEKQQRKTSMGHLVLPPPAVDALGSRDRRNALRLTDENERLRLAHARLAVRCVELERELKQLEGHPS